MAKSSNLFKNKFHLLYNRYINIFYIQKHFISSMLSIKKISDLIRNKNNVTQYLAISEIGNLNNTWKSATVSKNIFHVKPQFSFFRYFH